MSGRVMSRVESKPLRVESIPATLEGEQDCQGCCGRELAEFAGV
jgi:hypothetical protein